MKKRILHGLFALALLAAASSRVKQSMEDKAKLSDWALANVEALAQYENPGGGDPMIIPCRYGDTTNNLWSGTFLWRCQDCSYSICKNVSKSSTCFRY